jgi:hypothetical protein
MAQFTRLRDLYAYPGFVPVSPIRGVFGDPYAVVIALQRRRKKPPAESAARPTGPFTTSRSAGSATSTAAGDGSTWPSPFAAGRVAGAAP